MTTQPLHSVETRSSMYSKSRALLCLMLIAPVPSIAIWFAAFGATGPVGSAVWALAKIWLIVGPVLCWWFVLKQPKHWPHWSAKGLMMGGATGLATLLVIVAAYYLLARDQIDFSTMQVLLSQAGIETVGQYLAVALYLTLINSLIEEYVFRWFMFVQLHQLMPGIAAVAVSALIFTIHHTLVLSAYIPWQFNLLASVGVFSGGLIWSYLYYRYGRIWPGYVSHIGADIGVFLIGYDALF